MKCKKCEGQMTLKSVNTEVFMISIVEYKCECGYIKTEFINQGENKKG